MEVRIGVQDSAREVVFETKASADEITKEIENAVKNKTLISLVDDKGRKILIPGDRLTFVELGAPEQRRVGFAG
jgi:hypothetical protein